MRQKARQNKRFSEGNLSGQICSMKHAGGKSHNRSKKTKEKSQTQKDRPKKSQENCRESLTCGDAGKDFMRAIWLRKSQAKQGLGEICVGTSRGGKDRGNIRVGNFR